MSEEGKIVALGYQCIAMDTVMTIAGQVCKNSPVTPELCMHVSDIIVLITINTVVVVVAALV